MKVAGSLSTRVVMAENSWLTSLPLSPKNLLKRVCESISMSLLEGYCARSRMDSFCARARLGGWLVWAEYGGEMDWGVP